MFFKHKKRAVELTRALRFATIMLNLIRQYTTKHCEECVMNRERVDETIDYLGEMLFGKAGAEVSVDPADEKAVKAACAKINKAVLRRID